MLNWLSDKFLHVISWIPPWLHAEGTVRYDIVRGVLGLVLLVMVLLVITLRPDRWAVEFYRRLRRPDKDQ